jgi:tRNA(Arg) A34 adenosine deaminase TadA
MCAKAIADIVFLNPASEREYGLVVQPVLVVFRASAGSSRQGETETMTEPADHLASRLLEVMETDIIPLTRRGVEAGNKVFGAAVLKKSDFSLVLAETNNETENPLWHGEVHLLKRFYEHEIARTIPTNELIFLSTHEPCTMCMSAITWAGFDNFHYFFSHEDSRDAFAIPHDLKILKEVFGLEPGGYRRSNAFFRAVSIPELIEACSDETVEQLRIRAAGIRAAYDEMSKTYQDSKASNAIPLA